jgi:hypothetical protein
MVRLTLGLSKLDRFLALRREGVGLGKLLRR